MFGRSLKKQRIVIERQHLVGTVASVKPTALFARIGCNRSPVHSPRQDTRQHSPGIVSLSARFERKLVTPPHKNSACAAVSEGRKREVGIFRFNLFLNNSLVIVSGSLCELSEIFTGLI